MRILMINAIFPYPPISGNPIRIYNLIQRVSREHEVWLATFVRTSVETNGTQYLLKFCQGVETAEWQQIGALGKPIEAFRYFLAGKPPDLRLYQSQELVHKIKQLISKVDFNIVDIEDSFMGLYLEILPAEMHAKTVLTFHDVVFNKSDRLFRLETKLARKMRIWLHSRMMRRWEPKYAERFGHCIVVSETDKRLLLSANPRLQIDVVPNGVDTKLYQPLPCLENSPILIFVGSMAALPNIDAVSYFCHEIYPRIRAELPQVEFWIVGKDPTPEVLALSGDGVRVTGRVSDLLPYYSSSAVCVVPLRAGGGTRLKILEAMALGRPVVSSSIGCEGLEAVDGKHLLITDTPDRFVEEVTYLLRNPGIRQMIADQAREFVVSHYDWEVITKQLLKIYAEAAI